MKQIYTFARKHGEKTFKQIMGPSTPLVKQRRFLKQIKIDGEHKDYAALAMMIPIKTLDNIRPSNGVIEPKVKPLIKSKEVNQEDEAAFAEPEKVIEQVAEKTYVINPPERRTGTSRFGSRIKQKAVRVGA